MSGANIVHSGYGLRCEKLDKPLNLGWGWTIARCCTGPGLPTGWLCDALDQIFIAAPQLSAVVLPRSEWCEEPQALTLFGQVQSDIIHRSAFWQLPLWLSSPANRASGEMVLMQSVRFISRSAPVRRVKFIVVTIHAFAGC
ncbi:N(6)-hydroxylysine O-acetyltransferase [Escherichia coli]|nr:N(6)-hydroxylysine O-acetyltransferase [Escherichia coli]